MSRVTTAVILAAGLGSRLKEKTKERPKAFLPIDKKPLIIRSIENLLDNGITQIIIATGYLHEYFDALKEQFPMIRTHRNEDFATTGSMYTLYNTRHLITEDFLLLEADLLYEKLAVSALLDTPQPDVILASGKTNSNDEVYIEADDQNHLINMSKVPSTLSHISGELVGISKISPRTFTYMCAFAEQTYESGNLGMHYEDDLVGISRQTPIYIHKIDKLAWCEIDDDAHLQRAINEIYPIIQERDNV